MINLKDTVKDSITGFTGIVVSQTTWINGCVRLGVQSQKLKDGIPTEAQVFDIEQLILVKKAKDDTVVPKGGPRKVVSRQSVPKPF